MDEFGLKRAFDAVRAEDALKETTLDYVRQEMERRQKRRVRPVLRWAAATACMLLCVCLGWMAGEFLRPVSVISIDINPSLELGVNALDRVISVRGYNTDGEELTKELRLRFLPSAQAVERIIASDTVTALLGQDEELYITVVGEDADASEDLCQQLKQDVQGLRAHCGTTALEEVAQAHQCGFSYGKYRAYLAALAQEETLTAEAAQEMTMRELREVAHHSGEGHHGQTPLPTVPETTLPVQETLAPGCESGHGAHEKSGHGKNHH